MGIFFWNSSNSPSAIPVDVLQLGPLFNDHWVKLDGAVVGCMTVKGLTRSMERVPYDDPLGFLLGRGRLDGVYGMDMLTELVGVCDNEGAVLVVDATVDVEDLW